MSNFIKIMISQKTCRGNPKRIRKNLLFKTWSTTLISWSENKVSAVSEQTKKKQKNVSVILPLKCLRFIRVLLVNLVTSQFERDSLQKKRRGYDSGATAQLGLVNAAASPCAATTTAPTSRWRPAVPRLILLFHSAPVVLHEDLVS